MLITSVENTANEQALSHLCRFRCSLHARRKRTGAPSFHALVEVPPPGPVILLMLLPVPGD